GKVSFLFHQSSNIIPEDEATEEDKREDTAENNDTQEDVAEEVEKATLDDYYPFKKDTVYIFEGEGNEYAGFQTSIDFIDEAKNRMQMRTNNGGTEEVRVIEKKDGEVRVILSRPECYYRDNLINKEGEQGNEEILLKEPLEVGTEWSLPDGRKRYISGIDVDVETPMGVYQAIQVNMQESGDSEYIIKEYYVKGIGLVKSVYEAEGMVVTSSIKEIQEDTAFSQMINLYYVNIDEKVDSEPVTLTFHTNDITRVTIQDAVIKVVEGKKDTLPLMSINTKINSMYLGNDGIAYIDLSKEFVSDMNAGVGYEAAILQAITNTIGRYYGVQEVYLTIDHKPYESGHILFEKGQTMRVTE
ncbi:MAG TPA: GerMN domain-containing protein, partial [Lachnospiraceae bacterium]|nr:GerMN domain-containing protein [Lachnospiraceae bacterium]